MLSKCCNPSCVDSFRYLTGGKLFRLENNPSNHAITEYFWLCPKCSATMTLCISDEGEVIPVAVPTPIHAGTGSTITKRQKGLLLSDVSLIRRKDMVNVRDASADRVGRIRDGDAMS